MRSDITQPPDKACITYSGRRIRARSRATSSQTRRFTSWLREVVPDAPLAADGATVGAALDALFTERPHVRGYILDERGNLRKHVCIFAEGVNEGHGED